jgi:PTS system mannose-specific IID component
MSRAVLWRVLGRTLFLQACWNFQKMQNLGFAYALTPVLRVVYPSRATRAKALKRHLEFFVTHPYCASIILGVVAKLEEQVTSNGTYDSTDANRIKVGMMGPLAALGDTLFWATLRPMLALLGSAWVLIAFVVGGEWLWLGPVLFFGLYTLFHLNVRIGGLWLGYARGVDVVKDLRQLNPQRVSQQLGLFASMAAGVLAAAFFQLRTQPIAWAGWNSLNTALLSLLGLLFVVGLRRGWSVSRLIYLLVVLAVLAAYLFNLG